ncbi:MAG: hypothetical protein WBM00_01610 [Solirubrobacterales bacterium]
MLLLTIRPAAAANLNAPVAGPPMAPGAVELAEAPEDEAEESAEGAEEACEEGEAEVELEPEDGEEEAEDQEEEVECEPAGKKKRSQPPAECMLRSTHARLLAYAPRDKVLLLIRYEAFGPTSFAVDYNLTGRGGLKLGGSKQRFAGRGLLRLTQNLSRGQMAKVLAAKNLTLRLHIPAAPRSCDRFYTRHLAVSHATPSRVVWSQTR